MPLILGTNSIKDTGYDVANSARWGGTNNEYMAKTLGTPSNTKKMTWSFWTKKTRNENDGHIATVYSDGNNYGTINFTDANKFQVFQYISASIQLNLITTQVFRDNSAWSHFVIQMDTTQSTASDRCKVWHNGSRITDWATETYWAQDTAIKLNEASGPLKINAITTGAQYHGYVAEFIMCDGQTYQASDFGEFDSDSPTIWKPKDPSDLTFGTNGFWLDFEDSANLGNDANGGTDLTETNFAATDQATDTPTNNFCTWNALEYSGDVALSEGNLQGSASDNHDFHEGARGTMAVSSGKWYWEIKMVEVGDTSMVVFPGVMSADHQFRDDDEDELLLGTYGMRSHDGKSVISNGSALAYATWGASFADGDIVNLALDMDNNRLYIGKGGLWSDGSGNIDESSINAYLSLSTTPSAYMPMVIGYSTGADVNYQANFGSPPYAISSGNADANGYGNFEYAVPSGFYALCTKNLAEYG